MSTAYEFPEAYSQSPSIYAYSDVNYPGRLKIGYTTRDVKVRVAEQYPQIPKDAPTPYHIELIESAVREDGSTFDDHAVHRYLKAHGVKSNKEWFTCTLDQAVAAIVAVRSRWSNEEGRTQDFKTRPEQSAAIEKTVHYFDEMAKEGRTPRFLWNAKMRFGKTFTTYQLAKRLGYKRVLILTFKPAVRSAWKEDLETHVDFEGWQFIASPAKGDYYLIDSIDVQYQAADKSRPIVCFGSFQDFLGLQKDGSIKAKNEWVHTTNWDLVVFDEYHFGAWRDNAKKLFDDVDEEKQAKGEDTIYEEESKLIKEAATTGYAPNDETWLPITARAYLYLSGTPFRALNSGEFIEEQIYNWTYTDEQRAKEEWGDKPGNPYAALPKLTLVTYQLPDQIRKIAEEGEFNEFNLNVFFEAEGKENDAKFKHEDEVQKWLDLMRGALLEEETNNLKLGRNKAPMPFSDVRLLHLCPHTLWFLPNVAACYAMRNLLRKKQNVFYQDYKINVCAGTKAGVGAAALEPVERSMGNPLKSKSITLSCGKLTTGVTVKPWTGVLMLRNLSSPETYFQTAFRVQSPWTVPNESGGQDIVKQECFVFDFALNRALKEVADYSCRLSVDGQSPERKVEEIIGFLPVLAYDGAAMRRISASEILDIAMSGASGTMLARRWESALLVNVDNGTLQRLLDSDEALAALEKIEAFRGLNQDIEMIINKTDAVKKAKKDGKDKTGKEKKELDEEEKDIKNKRKKIQEKLIKLATRIPIFMYLTDAREECLKAVIETVEPKLFEKVTGLVVHDFQLLCGLDVFNAELMNDAVYKFKRYEDASLTYAGIDAHHNDARVGGFDQTITREEYNARYKAPREANRRA